VIIVIDLAGGNASIELVNLEDCKQFHVAAQGGSPEALAAALSAAGVGRLLPSGDAMIETQAIRRMAGGKVPATWDDDFAAMLEYANSKGWLGNNGEAIQAHVEWAS
jgi:hypothetical protein